MPKVGDRVIIEGAKVGQQRREGSLIGVAGRLLNVRWSDGSTSLLTPGAGSVVFLPKGSGNSGAPASKAGRKAGAGKAGARKAAPKRAAASKKAAKAPVKAAATKAAGKQAAGKQAAGKQAAAKKPARGKAAKNAKKK